MSMLSKFFDITKDSKEIFKDTKIMNSEYVNETNQWPTIFISFAGAKNNKETAINCINQEILREYRRYQHVLKNLDEFDQPLFENIKKSLLNNEDIYNLWSIIN